MRDGNSTAQPDLRRTPETSRLGDDALDALTRSFHEIIETVGEDPERQGLLKTPGRAARAFEFLTQGYRQSVEEMVNQAVFDSDANEIILVKDIELYSMCEHHLLPFIGRRTSPTSRTAKSSASRKWRASSISSRAAFRSRSSSQRRSPTR